MQPVNTFVTTGKLQVTDWWC